MGGHPPPTEGPDLPLLAAGSLLLGGGGALLAVAELRNALQYNTQIAICHSFFGQAAHMLGEEGEDASMGKQIAVSLLLIFLIFFLPWLWGGPARAPEPRPEPQPAEDLPPQPEEDASGVSTLCK